ncbi:MAG TPA: Stp1/IreP family PP2C-type Ser/Thr phosphatase [Pyrinomonadaceae bacterium]|jgi:protein phosphatase|nr:Stp1/IreP family PP2C-type Ser/Thr phosphatase [Pyrinomonadaceae bacterium]
MTDDAAALRLEAAAVTDRGLNERRPHNEDSMLSDPGRGIFAVADGVGGAEAGEVASQTAIEVLAEAFREHRDGDDAEDLMEIAIQRANDSIFHLSREDARYTSMATTIVALHIDGRRATVGHVGDSRLYSYSPDGRLSRETDDHSVVEEEVRAGRMTPEQAANHPSRNIISRAIGAEPTVEVDMKSIEFEAGTTFLLCSDGITRHIPDDEIAAILRNAASLEMACEKMKERCFERGAEDNLTAVLVRVGGAQRGTGRLPHAAEDDEVTLIQERPRGAVPAHGGGTGSLLQRPFHNVGVQAAAAPAPAAVTQSASTAPPGDGEQRDASRAAPAPAPASGGALRTLGTFFIVLAAAVAAFYAGTLYAGRGADEQRGANVPAAANATPAAETESERYERRRRAVDRSPSTEASRMAAEWNNRPLDADDPEFLYLYGRALLLSDRQPEAVAAFERAVQKAGEHMTPRNGELKIDARLAQVAAHLRSGDAEAARRAADSLAEVIRPHAAGENTQASPVVTP